MKDIDTTKRQVVSWTRGADVGTTASVTLNTDEIMVNAEDYNIESNVDVTVVDTGTVVTPSAGYEGMAKVTVTANPPFLKAYKHDDDFLFTKSNVTPVLTAYDSFTTTVAIDYDGAEDTITYNSNTYERDSTKDIKFV